MYQSAPPRTRDAAVTLADYIEKLSGQRPAVIDGESTPLPKRAIWVGVQPVVRRLFPAVDWDFQQPEETLFFCDGMPLVLAGRDRWHPERMEADGRLAMKTGIQQEYGTANAAYSFLQNQLGVRWLWPGEEELEPRKRLALAPLERRYCPQIRAQRGMFVKLSPGDNKEGVDELWARLQRVQLDSMDLSGGHGFGHWWETYGQDHPEYFAACASSNPASNAPASSPTRGPGYRS